MKNKIEVTKEFIEKSLEMAEDLYGLADMNRNTILKRDLKRHIVKCEKYIIKIGVNQK